MKDWREAVRLPVEPSSEWRAQRGERGPAIVGKSKVDRLLSSWHPLDNLLVAPPESNQLVPAICVDEIRFALQDSCARRTRISICIIFVSSVVAAILSAIRPEPGMKNIAVGLMSLALFMGVDFFLVMRNAGALTERANFFRYVRSTRRREFFGALCMMLIVGVTQVAIQLQIGSLERLVTKYGVLYAALDKHQWWRLFSGPLIHTGVSHWLVNLALLLLIAGVAGTVCRLSSVAVFVFASAAGACAAWQLSAFSQHDAYAGVSAGIFGLFGLCGGAALRRPHAFPHMLGVTIVLFSLLNIFLARIMTPNSSLIGHLVGFATGMAWGVLLPRKLAQQ